MAKKYNKGRKQKPNYSKRGISNVNLESGTDLELSQEISDKTCARSAGICENLPKKK